MISRFHFSLLSAVFAATSAFAASPDIRLDVDAREISRSLLHSRIEMPATSGDFVVWYPKWIPGVHAPAGPSENMAGLRFETPKGDSITWRRDEVEMNRFILNVPASTDRIIAKIDYICNQPSVNSSGVDSFGSSLLGVINWNTVLLYPESAAIDTVKADIHLQLPAGWKFGTSLKPDGDAKADGLHFKADTLRRVVDSPLICGEHMRDVELTGKDTPPAFLHLLSESPSAIALDDKFLSQCRKLVAEAVALFGGSRWEDYHFLVVCSDHVPHNGLEHLCSSFNVVSERDLVDEKKRKNWSAYLLPHEFVHAWCGKFRRPATMVTTNFHTPERTKLLWIYEGLTQYFGEVLTVRSGIMSFEDNLPSLASTLDYLMHQEGRRWRPLEDTATASWKLRAHSSFWSQLRRGQDYYPEGAVIWMEADALIREKTGGKKTLDDFAKKFFAADRAKQPIVVPYELSEVIADLKELADVDWDKFFADRTARTEESLNLDFFPKTLGYRLQYDATPSARAKEREAESKGVSATDSIGLSASDDGRISSIIPGLPADKAGLASGMVITGVNNRKFSPQRLKDGIADSPTSRKIELLILDGDTFRNVTLDYNGGPRYLNLVRANDHPDTLAEILKPVTK